jgi:hypothetical protein
MSTGVPFNAAFVGHVLGVHQQLVARLALDQPVGEMHPGIIAAHAALNWD